MRGLEKSLCSVPIQKEKGGFLCVFFFLKIPYIMPSSFLVNGHWARELLA
jgi:hypothetical protein